VTVPLPRTKEAIECFINDLRKFLKENTVTKTEVVNIRDQDYDVYIGRAGHGQSGYFGNRHPIGRCFSCGCVHDRAGAIAAFRKDFKRRIANDAEFKRRVEALKGKSLGCFCSPEECHGDVYVEYLESAGG